MFAEVKESLPISGDDYDAQIIREIKACALDLTTSAEIVLPGEIDITRTPVIGMDQFSQEEEITGWQITDNSTLKDELIITVISIWCNMRIGHPPNYDQLLKAYSSLKGQLRMSGKYTRYDGRSEEAEEHEDDDQLQADQLQP